MPSEVKESRAGTPLRRAIRWTALSLLVFVVVEAALFRLPWYLQYLQPNSSTGMFELSLYLLRHYRPDHVNEVLAVGDSRMAEGFSAWNATVLSGDQRLYFWNAGIAGSTPRVWYYYLRDADPNRNRFRAIVIGLDHYSDEDSYDSAQNRLTDLNYVVGRLRIGDIWDFSSSMRDVPNQRAALVGATLKGTVLRRDLHEFLEDIPKRVSLEKDAHRHGLIYGQNYNGRVGNLHGLMADWQNKTLSFPAGLDEDEKAPLTRAIFPVLPSHTGELTRYRRRWLGRILSDYRNSSTRLIFVEMPRAPLRVPESNAESTFVNEARRQGNVTVLDPSTFRDLETPETFFDSLHLNGEGRNIFSQRLGDNVRTSLLRP